MNKLKPEETICRDLWAYPVIDLANPRARVCCKRGHGWLKKEEIVEYGTDAFLNHPKDIQERDLMLQGYQVEGCKACWDLENNGQQSFRLGAMDFQFHFNNDVGEPIHYSKFRPFEQLVEEKDSLLRSDMPNKLDIGLGNYCDLKCVYCNYSYSSQWVNELSKFGLIVDDPLYPVPVNAKSFNTSVDDKGIQIWFDNFIKWFDSIATHLERIALMGGEPTYSPLFDPVTKHISKRLSESSHPNATVCIVTNLNWKPDVFARIINFRNNLPEHVKLRIEVSMESIGEGAEYIRNGVKWDKFLGNFKTLASQKNIEIVPITTLNALCIPKLKDYLQQIREIEIENDRNFFIIANRLIFPKWLSTNILNSNHKKYVDNTLEWIHSTYQNLTGKEELIVRLKEINNDLERPKNLELLGYFAKWIKEMDRRRNTNFAETFPELSDLLVEGSNYSKGRYTGQDLKKWEM